jgi:hypothetical protein
MIIYSVNQKIMVDRQVVFLYIYLEFGQVETPDYKQYQPPFFSPLQ